MSQDTIHGNINSFNLTNSFNNVWNNSTIADDRSHLLTWLSPLEPRLRHRDIQERRLNNVGEWLLETEEFRSWCDRSGEGGSDKAVLFCYGDLGVGKTFISSLVVDRLCDQTSGQNVAVGCFYFDFAARKEQSVTKVLGSLLKQVVGGLERIPEEIWQAFEQQKMSIVGRGAQLPDIVKMLQTITSSLRTFICIDALDECEVAHRVKIFDSLRQILEKSPGTRIFITGRPHIRAEVESRLAGRVTSVFVSPTKDDITEYLRVRLDEDANPNAMNESLAADILEMIPRNMSEMFLLVSLNIDAILHETTIYRRREKLNKMSGGLELEDVYGATVERIKAQGGDKSRLGMAALMWISHAERPLKVDELCHALAVELGSTYPNDYDVPSTRTLVGCCQGLITVDKEASTVRLIHFTLQEYLSAHPDIFSRPHSAMAEICLTYLNSQQIKALSTASSPDAENTPFLEYCSVFWGVHAKRELSDSARSLALELLKEYYSPVSIKLLLEQAKALDFGHSDTCFPFSGLHCASFFGISEVVATLIKMRCYNINEGDFLGCTPLAWAACNGHGEVVEILLGRVEINPDKPDNFGRTPLSHAAEYGHEEVVKILLGREEVNPDKPDNSDRTPLSLAAWCGHEEVVKILLGREEVNPDKPDNSGQSPLSFAAKGGHEGVVKILLGREEVYPDEPDNSGRTPLSHAAEYGHEGVVKILLGREEVNPNKPDNSGRTPLSHAAKYGHEGVVKILLVPKDLDPNELNEDGQTPLCRAASNGNEGVIKMLLGLKDLDPNKPSEDGQTPLWLASQNRHEGAVKLLLTRENINPNKPNKYGQTPLLGAARDGQESIVILLLGRGDINPNKPDNRGQTPLYCASWAGHMGVVKLLLGRGDVNPDKPDVYDQTPLFGAASNGHQGVVEALLERDDVNPDKPNIYGQTPLFGAVWDGNEGVVKMLLGHDDVNPGNADKSGRTPIWWATKYGHAGVLALLQPLASTTSSAP